MAISKEKQAEVIRKMKEQQAKKAAKGVNRQTTPKKEQQDTGLDNMEVTELRTQVAALKAKLEDSEKQNEKLAKAVKDTEKTKKYSIEQDAVNDILFGNENRIFEKDYAYPVKGSDDVYKFKIKLPMPNALQMGKIGSLVSDYLGDIANPSDQVLNLFTAIATFKVCALACPDWFKDPKKAYRWDIILDVYTEVVAWENTFFLPQQG